MSACNILSCTCRWLPLTAKMRPNIKKSRLVQSVPQHQVELYVTLPPLSCTWETAQQRDPCLDSNPPPDCTEHTLAKYSIILSVLQNPHPWTVHDQDSIAQCLDLLHRISARAPPSTDYRISAAAWLHQRTPAHTTSCHGDHLVCRVWPASLAEFGNTSYYYREYTRSINQRTFAARAPTFFVYCSFPSCIFCKTSCHCLSCLVDNAELPCLGRDIH